MQQVDLQGYVQEINTRFGELEQQLHAITKQLTDLGATRALRIQVKRIRVEVMIVLSIGDAGEMITVDREGEKTGVISISKLRSWNTIVAFVEMTSSSKSSTLESSQMTTRSRSQPCDSGAKLWLGGNRRKPCEKGKLNAR